MRMSLCIVSLTFNTDISWNELIPTKKHEPNLGGVGAVPKTRVGSAPLPWLSDQNHGVVALAHFSSNGVVAWYGPSERMAMLPVAGVQLGAMLIGARSNHPFHRSQKKITPFTLSGWFAIEKTKRQEPVSLTT
jgi:hypothetical protein